jgi:hypothetical protein
MFDLKLLKKRAAMQFRNPSYASETGTGALVLRFEATGSHEKF